MKVILNFHDLCIGKFNTNEITKVLFITMKNKIFGGCIRTRLFNKIKKMNIPKEKNFFSQQKPREKSLKLAKHSQKKLRTKKRRE